MLVYVCAGVEDVSVQAVANFCPPTVWSLHFFQGKGVGNIIGGGEVVYDALLHLHSPQTCLNKWSVQYYYVNDCYALAIPFANSFANPFANPFAN